MNEVNFNVDVSRRQDDNLWPIVEQICIFFIKKFDDIYRC